jgi:hypothetical protein
VMDALCARGPVCWGDRVRVSLRLIGLSIMVPSQHRRANAQLECLRAEDRRLTATAARLRIQLGAKEKELQFLESAMRS